MFLRSRWQNDTVESKDNGRGGFGLRKQGSGLDLSILIQKKTKSKVGKRIKN